MEIKEKFQKILGKQVRITLDDKRKVYGILHCIDSSKNMVIVDALEEIPIEKVSKINENLIFYVKNDCKIEKYIRLPSDILEDKAKLAEMENEFRKNKFYIGQVIIPGKNIKSLETEYWEK